MFFFILKSTDPDSMDKREIIQYHFTSWPDHSVPRDTAAFFMFHHKLKTVLVTDPGPVIVHCRSAFTQSNSRVHACVGQARGGGGGGGVSDEPSTHPQPPTA